MSTISRRKTDHTGLAAAAGLSGLAVAARVADRYGLIPPDHGGIYGPGETLTYAAQRLLDATFARARIQPQPDLESAIRKRDRAAERSLQAPSGRRLHGLAARLSTAWSPSRHRSRLPRSRGIRRGSQITEIACEEGWSILRSGSGRRSPTCWTPRASSRKRDMLSIFRSNSAWWESIDMADALHPQTLLAYGMNGGDLPVRHGGPLRLRVPRQLGYKSVKYINRFAVTDSLKGFGKGLGSASPEGGYAWYAGI